MDSKQDSNNTGLSIAEESLPRTLAANTKFYAQEPNSYSDFGQDVKRVTRRPISSDRQRLKGSNTDADVMAGFNMDLTQTNAQRLIQGFFFSTVAQKKTTAPVNGTTIPVTAVAGTGAYSVAGANGLFTVGDLVRTIGFLQYNNNGVGRVTAVSGSAVTITLDNALGTITETPPASARIEVVGVQYALGALNLGGAAGTVSTITRNNATDARDFTTLGLSVGEWICVGGDAATTKFASSKVGFARIYSITSTVIQFDKITWTPANDSGSGSSMRLFFGSFVKNGTTKRTYTLQRTLGSDNDGVQAEYVEGAVPNELTLHVPLSDKANMDLTYVGLGHEYTTGQKGLRSADNGATLIGSPGEAAFNTSSDIFHSEISVINPAIPYDNYIVGYLNSFDLSVKNNVSANKAIGTFGGFNHTAGMFEVSATANAYFTDVSQMGYTISNSDISVNLVLASNNAAHVFDLPLCSVTGDKVTVEQDAPITLPLAIEAVRNKTQYTVSHTAFAYVPNLAMPGN